jgi:hypothetical protein
LRFFAERSRSMLETLKTIPASVAKISLCHSLMRLAFIGSIPSLVWCGATQLLDLPA